MSFLKTQLKAAKEALSTKNYEYCKETCEAILENDRKNYHALVFLGLSQLNLEEYNESKIAFTKASTEQPDQVLAYQVIYL